MAEQHTKPTLATVQPTMHLSRVDKQELIVEVIVTMAVVLFITLSSIFLMRELVNYPVEFHHVRASMRERFQITSSSMTALYSVIVVMGVAFGLFFTKWRFDRRVKQMRLSHVLHYIQYIASGHYDVRIPNVAIPELKDVVQSINHLVDSTVDAMEEERRAEKTKDELISNIGHDLRTPLTSIIGYLGLVENHQYKTMEDILDYTHIAYSKAQHMQKLVNDLFDYTQSITTVSQLNRQKVNIYLYLSQLAADFELQASEKHITIDVQVSPETVVGEFDVEKMARVCHNLMSNAIKYGVGATEIILKATAEYHRNTTTLNYITFEVINDGMPIPQTELEAIFQRSYRSDQSRSSDQAGTGLGLSIVKNIIELHEGDVYATIEENKTKFIFVIPQ